MSLVQKNLIGRGALQNLAQILQQESLNNLLVIHGGASYDQCGAKKIVNNLTQNIVGELTFQGNPNAEDLERLLTLVPQNAETILAIGGGAVIDMAKLIRYFSEPNLPLVAIPTTAGTGAETTPFAVIYRNGIKDSVDSPALLPDIAIIDASLTDSNSAYLTACTGFDALSQAVEAYWSRNATPESDVIALQAITLIAPNLVQAVNNPVDSIKDKMAEGSHLAGKAISITRTTGPHAFSYPFTTKYQYPHGHAVGLTFPMFAEINFKSLGDKELPLRKALGMGLQSPHLFFSNLIKNIGLLPKHTQKQIDEACILSGINLHRLGNNPIPIPLETAIEIIRGIFK